MTTYLGEACDERIELDRSEYDFRRIFVSNPKLAGHRLPTLNLPQQFGAIVTRVRRVTWSCWRTANDPGLATG